MAFHAYASFKGKTQGQIKGESQKANRSDKWTKLISFEMGGANSIDSKNGSPKGARTHQPIVITKQMGSASPQLLQAHWANEVFSEVIIESIFDVHVHKRISLTNATIARFDRFPALNARTPSKHNTNGLDRISFTYTKILVEDIAGSTSTSDDWTTPNS